MPERYEQEKRVNMHLRMSGLMLQDLRMAAQADALLSDEDMGGNPWQQISDALDSYVDAVPDLRATDLAHWRGWTNSAVKSGTFPAVEPIMAGQRAGVIAGVHESTRSAFMVLTNGYIKEHNPALMDLVQLYPRYLTTGMYPHYDHEEEKTVERMGVKLNPVASYIKYDVIDTAFADATRLFTDAAFQAYLVRRSHDETFVEAIRTVHAERELVSASKTLGLLAMTGIQE